MLSFTATRSLICVLFEVSVIYAGFYLSDAPVSPATLDLFALVGYKYVALNLDILVGILFGSAAFWVTFLALGISTVVFMVRTLNGWVPSSTAALGSTPASPRFRVMFVVFACIQLLFSLFLLYPALGAIHSSAGVSGVWSAAAGVHASHESEPLLGSLPSSAAGSLPAPAEPKSSHVEHEPVLERTSTGVPHTEEKEMTVPTSIDDVVKQVTQPTTPKEPTGVTPSAGKPTTPVAPKASAQPTTRGNPTSGTARPKAPARTGGKTFGGRKAPASKDAAAAANEPTKKP